jgi:lycopene elongase/hydratase (dihydrobisanhydrobacterioruberin-forming)
MVTRARAAGYALFGIRFDYLLHLRPSEWPIMAAHTAVGYLLAEGLAGARAGRHLGTAIAGLLLWVVCLNGGTLALNSAFDRDEGDIAYLRQPPPVPRGLAGFSLGLMVAGQLVAGLLPLPFALVYAGCLLLSVLYSVPPFRLKAVAGVDWVINMWGFGTLTPYAGWASAGVPVDPARGLVLLAFCPLFAALYPLTQLYQIEEDRRRGDRTFASALGPERSLDVALVSAAIGFGLLVFAAVRAGWRLPGDGWRVAALGVAAVGWAVVLIPWRLQARRLSPGDHQRGMYRALAAWAATDVAVVLGWAW